MDDFGDWQDVPESQDRNADEEEKQEADDDAFADFLSAPTAADKEPEQEDNALKRPVVQEPFDANSLLAGFMADVGAGSKKQERAVE